MSLFGSKGGDAEKQRKEELKAKEYEMAQQKKKEDDEGSGHVGTMKRGDYMIHVFLEKGKDLMVPENSTVDPMLEVTCMGQKDYSQAKDDIGGISEITWMEHIFLEPKNVKKETAEKGKIKLRLLDKGLFKNVLIGEFEFDVTKIYFRKDHALLHKWLALSDPYGDDYSKITGYLKVSISVTCTGDESIKIEEDDEAEEDTEILMPPSLNPIFYQLKIRLFSAQKLPIMDNALLGLREEKTDAYVVTEYKGRKLKTQVVEYKKPKKKANEEENGGDAIWWNEEIWIPAQYPVIQKTISFRLMDQDEVYDEVVGSMEINVEELIEQTKKNINKKGKESPYQWKNIYGSPMGYDDTEIKKQMNLNPDIASNWKGRVLISTECVQTEKPCAKVQPIEEEEYIAKAQNFNNYNQEFRIIAEVGQACCLPEKNKKYTVKILVGGIELQTEEAKVCISNYNRFNERFDGEKSKDPKDPPNKIDKKGGQVYKLPYLNVKDIGHVLVLLMDDKEPVCYYRTDIEKFSTVIEDYQWIFLKPDPVVNKVKDPHQAGYLSLKMYIVQDSNFNFKDYDPWKKKPALRLQPIKVRAYIYQCRDLPASDENGATDSYVTVWDLSDDKKGPKQTKVIEDNLNPLFYECLELDFEVRDINDKKTYPPFIVDVWDKDEDLFDSQDDFLGRAIIHPQDANMNLQEFFEEDAVNEIPQEPKWHPFRFTEDDPQCGELLVSFSVAQIDYNFSPSMASGVDLASRVRMKECDVNILILGLRQLESPGILPIKKAFINFNVKSLVPPSAQAVQNIKTEPGPPGPNPTLNSTIKFSIPLPTEPLYCPKLSSFVYDNIFTGLSQALVGTFTLPIGNIMVDLGKEREEETSKIIEVNQKLQDLINGGAEYQPKNYSANTSINFGNNDNDQFYGNSERDDDTDIDRVDLNDQKRLLDESDLQIDTTGIKKGNSDVAGIKPFSQVRSSIKKNQNKQIQKKGLGKDKDLNEVMGPNDERGKKQADNQREAGYERIKNIKSMLINKGIDTDAQGLRRKAENMAERLTPNLKAKRGAASLAESELNKKFSKQEQLKMYKKAKEQEKGMEQDDRIRAEENQMQEGKEITQVIKHPQYKAHDILKVDMEINPPSDKLYIGLGWDEDKNTKRMHYRQFYPDELENVKEIFEKPSPFNTYDIKKGQSRGLDSGGIGGFFTNLFKTKKKDESGQDSTEKIVGKFKGIVEVESKEEHAEYLENKEKYLQRLLKLLAQWSELQGHPLEINLEKLEEQEERRRLKLQFRKLHIEHLDITKKLTDLNSDIILKNMLNTQEKSIIRLYIIDAFNLSSRDNGSPSDPYLSLKCNETSFNERDNYQLDEPNPKFNTYYDFEGTFPGCSPLEISVYDYDDIFGDDLIGTSYVDLEDRFFTLSWRSLHQKPIEYRQLYHQSSMLEQGVVRCWVEIHSAVKPKDQMIPWDIAEKPYEYFEVRICVFNCKDVVMMDAEGTSDVYCRGFFDSKEDVQETDTHYRNQNGKPDFQYRLVYKVAVPRKDFKFTLQMYDRDFFVMKEMIGEAQLNLKKIVQHCALTKKPMQLNKKYYNDVLESGDPLKKEKIEFDPDDASRFWLNMKVKDKDSHDEKVRGKVKMQIDVMPIELAEKNKVGKAREQPNHSPVLPEPEGRLKLSLNPFDMFAQMIGPEVRRKIICNCILFILCMLCVALAPMMLSGISTNIICKGILKDIC